MTVQLRGVLTALATPFTADGSVDEALLRKVVDRSIDGGVHGVVACGSTGEFSTLTVDERRMVVETVVDQAAERVPVIAQTGAPEHGRGDQALPARAVRGRRRDHAGGALLRALSVEETVTYLRAVAGSVDIPVMIYNLPVATGVDLYPDTVGALAREVENIRYIKNTTIDMAQSAELIHNHGDVISTFVGWDSLLLAALSEGAAGVMAARRTSYPPARRRLRRCAPGRPRRRPPGLGPGLPAHRRDHERTLHPGDQGGHGGGGLPRRRPPPTVRRTRPDATGRIARLAQELQMSTPATTATPVRSAGHDGGLRTPTCRRSALHRRGLRSRAGPAPPSR